MSLDKETSFVFWDFCGELKMKWYTFSLQQLNYISVSKRQYRSLRRSTYLTLRPGALHYGPETTMLHIRRIHVFCGMSWRLPGEIFMKTTGIRSLSSGFQPGFFVILSFCGRVPTVTVVYLPYPWCVSGLRPSCSFHNSVISSPIRVPYSLRPPDIHRHVCC